MGDSPYRSAPQTEKAQAPRDAGIVGDIIGQFADRFAFFRELVQNAIDADTPGIEVRIAYEASLERIVVAVEDRGEGMNRDVIENRLLVLFRSTKEDDEDKIGKFGIGFASVLALGPQVIRVNTVRDGQRHVLELYPDLSYELFDGGRATKSGTTVELELAARREEVDDFVTNSWGALERWCRHATVPITLRHRSSDGELLVDERIDRPLGIEDAVLQVSATSKDGRTLAVVGLRADAQPYVGFFNYGLTLYENREGLLGPYYVKLQDARLGHTLSRDNVQRDFAFDRAMRFARSLIDDELPMVATRTLSEAIETGDGDRYRSVLLALVEARVKQHPADIPLPLFETVGDDLSSRGRPGRARLGWSGRWAAFGAHHSSPLTSHLAANGHRVVDLGFGGTGEDSALALAAKLCDARMPSDVALLLTLASPVELTSSDLAMLERLEEFLEESHRSPAGLFIAELSGAFASDLAITGPRNLSNYGDRGRLQQPWLCDGDKAQRSPFRLLMRPSLILNTLSTYVDVARKRAEDDPLAAASFLARLLLLQHDKLDLTTSTALLEHGLDELMGDQG